MSKKISEACQMALTRAVLWDARVSCLDRWASEANTPMRGRPIQYEELRNAMMGQALSAWRNAMMWGLVSDDLHDQVKQAAADRFLKVDGPLQSSIMQHLDPKGEHPGRWMADAEEEFRAEIRLALGKEPKETR